MPWKIKFRLPGDWNFISSDKNEAIHVAYSNNVANPNAYPNPNPNDGSSNAFFAKQNMNFFIKCRKQIS